MDVSKIIYVNEVSGKTVLCSKGDVHAVTEMNIYGTKYIPERHLEKLLLDKKITYTCFRKGLSWLLELFAKKNVYFSQFTDRFFTLELSLLSVDDEKIIVNCSETVELLNGKNGNIRSTLFNFPSIGKIKFIKRKNIGINDIVGDAAIVIYDIGQRAGSAYEILGEDAAVNLTSFALSIGLSLFVEMEGDWNKIVEDSKNQLIPVSEKLDNAKKENVILKEDNESKAIEIHNLNQEKSELNILLKEMKEQLHNLQKEIEQTRQWAYEAFHFDGKNKETLDVSNKEDWVKFQSIFLKYAETLKNCDLKTDKKQRLEAINKEFKKKYNKFDKGDLKFLATGQYLLEMHKEENMDFSPILIDFAKCLEDVLAKFLVKKLVVPEDEKPMLGTSLLYIKNNSDMTGFSKMQTNDFVAQLRIFIDYRNKAVHKEGVTLNDVLKAKEILLSNFGCYSHNYLLDYIHSYY